MRHRSMLMIFSIVLNSSLLFADAPSQMLQEGQGPGGPKQPQAYVSADGTVDVVFVVGDEIRIRTSRNRGQSFTKAKSAIRSLKVAAGMRRGPRLVRTKSALVVTAIV